ncbi:hypothetical protein BDV95DRAFT_630205 [Massariosphaeria phaeospora]|uniref:Uncharacterized protein n=1 Tax=Massariosphaeria phaeospora TaxID=100035 RepID=A0A7C8I2C9_9PLEO|nr:hypothetical protein BDV95DRAFT_630205 [Massariosphaeria phaeospora]
MPAERRTTMPVKPLKTERTHEENQERAYIAASRRSDRSLEARIESARRASEIHKRRTGRALRVTEQDVVNEEMYEEEDDDIPSQYQRLSAHLQTSSLMFNRKLQDYIATQHGVRNMFLSQYQPPRPFSLGNQYQQNQPQYVNQHGFFGQGMLPPQTQSPSQPMFNQPSQPLSPQGFQPQLPHSHRQAPYAIPPRQQLHQRAASIAAPQHLANARPSMNPVGAAVTAPDADAARRMSLPQQSSQQHSYQAADGGPQRLPLSRSTTSQSINQQTTSPRLVPSTATTPVSAHGTPQSPSEGAENPPQPYFSFNPATNSQVLNTNPLTFTLPPESQQFVGNALDFDPNTAIFMAGSDNLPQYYPTYTYNPNLSPKSSRPDCMSQTQAPNQGLKVDTTSDSASLSTPSSAMNGAMYQDDSIFSNQGYDQGFFDHAHGPDMGQGNSYSLEEYDENQFLQFD